MSIPTMEDDPDFQQFTRDLEELRGQVALHSPDDRWVSRVMSHLPPVTPPAPPRQERFFRWAVPFVVGGAAASIGILFFSPFAPFDVVRKATESPTAAQVSPVPQAAPEQVAQARKATPENTAVRLTRLMDDYQVVNRWLSDAGITSPANKAYSQDVLTELAATGFTDNDWKLYRAALPAPRSVTELLQGAQCAHLWQR
jgi:hypothetical protein